MTLMQLLYLVAIALVQRFGWLGIVFQHALDQLEPLFSYSGAIPAFAAPHELIEWLQKTLHDAVNQIDRPLIRNVLLIVVDNYLPQVLDMIWDQLFNKNMVGCSFADSKHPVSTYKYDDALPISVLMLSQEEASK